MSESMIERLARAMAAADSGPEGSALFDIHWREFGSGYLISARVAIEAMREPTEEIDAAVEYGVLLWAQDCGTTKDIWRSSIDAALSTHKAENRT